MASHEDDEEMKILFLARHFSYLRLFESAIAELAESTLARCCKIIGGGTFNRSSPFGFWYEDVRALGFLRPPWGLAHDNLFGTSFE